MDDDQQFCLRWNNHQSTLVAVFDTLLENGTLVDCTLAAEGKYLNAHKVVLSACSPYFEALLSKHFDKHPIVVLKDVKFQELKAMMDYMYRGEVNISQDQLGALLKAAESLQIKGLSDNKRGETERKPVLAAPTAPKSPPPAPVAAAAALPKVQGLTIEQRRDDSREGSASPGPRKKKRLRRRSDDLDNHDASNSSESHSLPASAQNAATPAKMTSEVPEPVESKADVLTRHKQPPADEVATMPVLKEKLETHSELMLEPKSEYVDEMNEDSIEDLTLDDDDLSNMEQMDDQAGPSHGNAGEGSSQGFGGWHMGNQSQDEVFLAAQEAVGAHRDSQEPETESTDQSPPKSEGRVKKTATTKRKSSTGKIPKKRTSRKGNANKNAKKRLPKHKFKISFYVRNGITYKLTRCIECGSFIGKDWEICRRCEITSAMRVLGENSFPVITKKMRERNADTTAARSRGKAPVKVGEKEKSNAPKKTAGVAASNNRKKTPGSVAAKSKKAASSTSLKKTVPQSKSKSIAKKLAVTRKIALKGKQKQVHKKGKITNPKKKPNPVPNIVNDIQPDKLSDEMKLATNEGEKEPLEEIPQDEEDIQYVSFNDLRNIIDGNQ